MTLPSTPRPLRHWIAAAVLATSLLRPQPMSAQTTPPPYGVSQEVFTNQTAAPYPPDYGFTNGAPNIEKNLSTSFSTANVGKRYGQRLRAYIVAPLTGNYAFSIASSEWSDLYLSTDELPEHRVRIANVGQATAQRDFSADPSQQSARIPLEAGRRYFIEVLHRGGTNADYMDVQWQLPDDSVETPIAVKPGSGRAERLVPFKVEPVITPAFLKQPTNQTVLEGRATTLTLLAGNQNPVTYQWQLDGVDIPNATNASLFLPRVTQADHGGKAFRCVASNATGSTPSAEARISITPDVVPPTVAAAVGLGTNGVLVTFSEPVQSASATAIGNYTIPGITIAGATQLQNPAQVVITAMGLAPATAYTLSIAGVRDLAGLPVADGTKAAFTTDPFNATSVGSTNALGSVTPVGSDGFDITAGGRDAGGKADQFLFSWGLKRGDFDVQVRVTSIRLSDLLAKAGLMAREDLSSTSRFAAVFATPSLNGCLMEARSTPGKDATNLGMAAVNYPDTYLRLQRSGSVFRGYASSDAQNWTSLGGVTLSVPEYLYVGFAATSHDTNDTTVATLREFQDATGHPLGRPGSPDREPPGPSSRRTGLVLSEIMYHPHERPDGKETEFVEIFNSQPFFEDMSGYSLQGDIDYTFPTNTILEGGTYLVVAKNPADLMSAYGITGVLGPYSNSIPNNVGTLRLVNELGGIFQEVTFDTQMPWPIAADGAGHSLILARPSVGEGSVGAWQASDAIGGSPGRAESMAPEPLRKVVINEFLANPDPAQAQVEFLELYNRGNTEVDLSGAWLSDSASTNKYRVPNGTRIASHGYARFLGADLGFGISSTGESLYLVNASQTRVIDAIRFLGSARGVAQGRTPDGDPEIVELAAPTPGTPNAARLVRDIVINEILYAPISSDNDDEFIELYNKGAQTLSLAGWKLSTAVSFTFPTNASIPAGGYAVVGRNVARLLANYPDLNPATAFGNYSGSLANSGDRIRLLMPEAVAATNNLGQAVTNTAYVVVNDVAYGTEGRWGRWADGGGSSLELIDPHSDNRRASNWADSDETRKAPWTVVERTGLLDLGAMADPTEVHLFLENPGEALVDDIEVFPASTPVSVVKDGGFEDATLSPAWTPMGTQENTSLEKGEAYSGAQSLHLRATGRGDIGGNKIYTSVPFTKALAKNTLATIRYKCRWLAGSPFIMVRLYGNYLECPAQMTLPRNLGTPGARNSRSVGNAGPAIHQVTHFPVLPQAQNPIRITARIADPDGVGSVTLAWRNDTTGSSTYSQVPMVDDGTGADEVAGDGLYTALIPGQANNAMVAYYIAAQDSAAVPIGDTFPSDAPKRECLVHVGETQQASAFATYRIWITQATASRWKTRGKQSNAPLDCTVVYNDYRVIYNATTLYSGSPWHTPGYDGPLGPVCDYVLHVPADDPFLGAGDFVLASIGNTDNDPSKLAEQSSYWIARKMGVPYNYRRFFFLNLNGVRRATSVYEDTQQPSGDLITEYYSNDKDGRLHKIEDWFEFKDDPSQGIPGDNQIDHFNATLDNWTTLGGAKKPARYRVNWRPRSVGTGQSPDDFSDLYKAVDAIFASQPEPFETMVKDIVHLDRWFRLLGMEHIVGNWDSWGYRRGKNMYAYKPTKSRWDLLLWDIDFDLGSGGDDAQHDLFESVCDNSQPTPTEPAISRLLAYPAFRRHYLRILEEAAQGPLKVENFGPLLDAKYKALLDNGAAPSSPSFMKDFVTARRTYILGSVVPKTNFMVFGTNLLLSDVNWYTVTGAAPVVVDSILVNGQKYPTAWSSIGSRPIYYSIQVPLDAGTNTLVIDARDRFGNTVSNGLTTVQVVYTGAVPDPAGTVVINEISYDPINPGAGFVELYNRSATTAFSLAGWRLSGAAYTFPDTAAIGPRQYVVVAKDLFAFSAKYRSAVTVLGEFPGNLSPDGETLTLLRPKGTAGDYTLVDRVRYEALAPWYSGPGTLGTSLELIDPGQDRSRVSNWTDEVDGWRFFSVTGKAGGTNLWVFLTAPGDVYIDDLRVVEGTQPAAGVNLVSNGGFESPLAGTWRVATNLTGSALSTDIQAEGGSSLHLVATAPGKDATNASLNQLGVSLVTTSVYTLSCWMHYGSSGSNLVVMMGKTLASTQQVNRVSGSPGRSNFAADTLPAGYPALWLNEVSPYNEHGPTDAQGERDPWLELYNAGMTPIDLTGMYLSDSYAALDRWAFPAGSRIGAGEFLVVWADGEPETSSSSRWHTTFRLQPTEGSVVLSRRLGTEWQILDYLNYTGLKQDEAYGAVPDGQPFERLVLSFPTPGAPNNGTSRPLSVKINEWMASNTGFLLDPADTPPAADDWFELYNPGRTDAELGGYYLTDSTQKPTQFKIPAGTVIPAGGYLLVWADGTPSQNSTNSPDLHVNFQLAKAGEEIVLFAPDGTVIDAVKFGTQTNNISQGRLPDGGDTLVFFDRPTPRAANRLSGANTPPVLTSIGDRTLSEGRRFVLQLKATDAEEGSGALVYTSSSALPIGASLTPGGLFVWRPSESQGPGFYTVTFQVNDNGAPSMADAETVTFHVLEVNQPPLFRDLRTRYVKAGDDVSFATAIDQDLPAQILAFRLGAGAPGGLTLDPITGIVRWKPGQDQAGQQYPVTVIATDDGVPNLSSTFTYVIQVVPAGSSILTLDATVAAGGVVVKWNTEQGVRYQLEWRSEITSAWQPLGDPVTATGPTTSRTLPAESGKARFYRVTQL
jgi:hypothetical protein